MYNMYIRYIYIYIYIHIGLGLLPGLVLLVKPLPVRRATPGSLGGPPADLRAVLITIITTITTATTIMITLMIINIFIIKRDPSSAGHLSIPIYI